MSVPICVYLWLISLLPPMLLPHKSKGAKPPPKFGALPFSLSSHKENQ